MKIRPGIEIIVNGYSDDIGTEEYNFDLSKDRASAVKNYLVQNGIGSHRISTNGFGKTRPIAPNDSEEGRQLNRRIEIVIIKK
jgi:OOP family OmpA-OmpF porin